jgi:rod shape-determining protein MreC
MTNAGILPDRQWVRRVSQGLLTAAALSLLVMSKTGNPIAVNLRTTILDTVTPFIAVASSPINAVSDVGEWFSGVVAMHAENVALKNQNLQLLQWQAMAKRMEAENESLKRLMKVIPAQKYAYITAHIVSDLGGPYAQSALINGGSEQGIKADQAVINEDGLIGRIIDTGGSSGRVLLLNDINSRVPVMSERTREKSILSGNNTGLPTLSYLTATSTIQVGDRVITSGDGGIFPSGIPVGIVSDIEGGRVKVQPFADISRIEYVSVIDYSF